MIESEGEMGWTGEGQGNGGAMVPLAGFAFFVFSEQAEDKMAVCFEE
jgi:hypothetical protein